VTENYLQGGEKLMRKFFTILLLGVCLLLIGCTSQNSSDIDADNENHTEKTLTLIDVNQFSRISPEELIEIMGEPNSRDEWDNLTSRGRVLIEIYEYDGYDFFIADNSVVRMNIYSEKYYNPDGDGIKFSTEEDIFHMLNIPIDYDRIKKIADTGYALRYSPVSDKVADVWCVGIDKDNNSIEEIRVTFNLNYFQ